MHDPRFSRTGSDSIPQRPAAARVDDVITDADLDEELTLQPVADRVPVASLEKPLRDRAQSDPKHPLDADDLDDEFDGEPLVSPTHQFTLRDMMIFTLLAAVGFGLMRIFPPSYFAGAMGGVAILGLAVLSIFQPEKLFYHLLWWTVLGIYILSSVFAVIAK